MDKGKDITWMLNEEVLLGRVELLLAHKHTLLGMSPLDLKAWQWLGSVSFMKANTKAVYMQLSYKKD